MDSVRQAGNDTRRHYAFEAERGPFIAFAVGRLVHLRSTLRYAARGFYKPVLGPTIGVGCGNDKERPRIVIELATPLSLTADWHLSSQARLVSLAPASDEAHDQCDVSVFNYNVTNQVLDAARGAIVAHLPDIDKRVGEVDLNEQFTSLWRILERPIRLIDGVWLILGPEQLLMGKVVGSGRVLTVPVTLVAHPLIETSANEPAVQAKPLPRLGRDTASGGFRVSLDGAIDYAAASNAITLVAAERQITEGGHTVTAGAIAVSPASRGRLSVAVTFTGDANGTLFLVGTPIFDPVSRTIAVPDLDYDLDTDSPLINTYTWLRSETLRETLRAKARVPVDSALEKGRQLLLQGLNRKIGDALTLSATVDSVAVQGIFVTRAALIVRAVATGEAKVSVRQR